MHRKVEQAAKHWGCTVREPKHNGKVRRGGCHLAFLVQVDGRYNLPNRSPAYDNGEHRDRTLVAMRPHIHRSIMNIREAAISDAPLLARLISESNRDVAQQFGLKADNCPKHPSFCAESWVQADFARGERYFILEEDSAPVACVAYETPSPDLAYLNRLSVLPAHRRRGIGACLVSHIVGLARAEAIRTISIGVIGEHDVLQSWYVRQGFVPGETKRFPHLPFSVRYMNCAVDLR